MILCTRELSVLPLKDVCLFCVYPCVCVYLCPWCVYVSYHMSACGYVVCFSFCGVSFWDWLVWGSVSQCVFDHCAYQYLPAVFWSILVKVVCGGCCTAKSRVSTWRRQGGCTALPRVFSVAAIGLSTLPLWALFPASWSADFLFHVAARYAVFVLALFRSVREGERRGDACTEVRVWWRAFISWYFSAVWLQFPFSKHFEVRYECVFGSNYIAFFSATGPLPS